MIDVQCISANEGLFAVFMDAAGAQSVGEALLSALPLDDMYMCMLVEDLVEGLEQAQDWCEHVADGVDAPVYRNGRSLNGRL